MGLRVIVVEPNTTVAREIALMLEERGHLVTCVGSSKEANHHPRHFDCGVFADELPDGSGVALAGWFLAENRVRCVVFFSNSLDADARLRASNLGSFVHRSEGLHALCVTVEEAASAVALAAGAEGSLPVRRRESKSGSRPKGND